MPSEKVRERCKKLKVLVAEDEEEILELITLVLKDLQVQTIWKATDGAKAWDFFLQLRNQIDLVICDWVMPEVDGLEVLRRIRDTKSAVPFLMLTGKVTVDAVAAARNLAVTAYVAKPFDPLDLRKKIIALVAPEQTVAGRTGKKD